MAKTYRKLKVRAVVGDKKSDQFYVQQQGTAPEVERFVARIDVMEDEKYEGKVNVSNADHQVFGLQNAEWLEEKLLGFRMHHNDLVLVRLEVVPSELPAWKDLEGKEAF